MKKYFALILAGFVLATCGPIETNSNAQTVPENMTVIKQSSGAGTGSFNASTGFYYVIISGDLTSGDYFQVTYTDPAGVKTYIYYFSISNTLTTEYLVKSINCEFVRCLIEWKNSSGTLNLYKTSFLFKLNTVKGAISCPATTSTGLFFIDDSYVNYIFTQETGLATGASFSMNGFASPETSVVNGSTYQENLVISGKGYNYSVGCINTSAGAITVTVGGAQYLQ